MTKEEYQKKIDEKRALIDEISHQIDELKKECCIEHSPLKIGDKIKLNDKEGYITDIQMSAIVGLFEYKWKPINAKGKPGYERKIWSFDVHKIMKV